MPTPKTKKVYVLRIDRNTVLHALLLVGMLVLILMSTVYFAILKASMDANTHRIEGMEELMEKRTPVIKEMSQSVADQRKILNARTDYFIQISERLARLDGDLRKLLEEKKSSTRPSTRPVKP